MSMEESGYLGHTHDSFYTRYLEPVNPRLPGPWQAEEAAIALWNRNSKCSLYVWIRCEELAVQLSIGKILQLAVQRQAQGSLGLHRVLRRFRNTRG